MTRERRTIYVPSNGLELMKFVRLEYRFCTVASSGETPIINCHRYCERNTFDRPNNVGLNTSFVTKKISNKIRTIFYVTFENGDDCFNYYLIINFKSYKWQVVYLLTGNYFHYVPS